MGRGIRVRSRDCARLEKRQSRGPGQIGLVSFGLALAFCLALARPGPAQADCDNSETVELVLEERRVDGEVVVDFPWIGARGRLRGADYGQSLWIYENEDQPRPEICVIHFEGEPK